MDVPAYGDCYQILQLGVGYTRNRNSLQNKNQKNPIFFFTGSLLPEDEIWGFFGNTRDRGFGIEFWICLFDVMEDKDGCWVLVQEAGC